MNGSRGAVDSSSPANFPDDPALAQRVRDVSLALRERGGVEHDQVKALLAPPEALQLDERVTGRRVHRARADRTDEPVVGVHVDVDGARQDESQQKCSDEERQESTHGCVLRYPGSHVSG